MPIPLNTTTISVSRAPDLAVDIDEYESSPTPPVVVATGIRAVISLPSGSNRLNGGDRIVFNAKLVCDETDLQSFDTVTDLTTGDVWTVLNARTYGLFGLAHTEAQLRQVVGASA